MTRPLYQDAADRFHAENEKPEQSQDWHPCAVDMLLSLEAPRELRLIEEAPIDTPVLIYDKFNMPAAPTVCERMSGPRPWWRVCLTGSRISDARIRGWLPLPEVKR